MPEQPRLVVVCEGVTESGFVKRCLAPHLGRFGIWVWPSLIKTKPGKQGGGDVTVERVGQHLAFEAPSYHFLTTLVDLYRFRDRQALGREALEQAIKEDVFRRRPELGYERVMPYVQQYEFEALLFSDIQGFEWVLDGWSDATENELAAIKNQFEDPEQINDGPASAPSKRLENVFGSLYKKTEHGPIIAEDIGLSTIRAHCPRFDDWVTRLERLSP